jgi:hypothetical protein
MPDFPKRWKVSAPELIGKTFCSRSDGTRLFGLAALTACSP